VTEEQLTDLAELIGHGIGQSMIDNFGPGRVGFTLLIFNRADPLNFAYTSSEGTEGMIKSLQHLLTALKASPRPA